METSRYELSQRTKNIKIISVISGKLISIHIYICSIVDIMLFSLTAWKMEIDYTFKCRIFRSKKSVRAKILTELKTAFILNIF